MANIVLIHGAYQGGWIWRYVAAKLRGRGHNVLTPTLDGCGERAHALRPGITTETHGAEIAELLFYEDLRDVVLAGTSSGGMVMAAAAERARDRIARVVFADALALMDGEKIRDIVKRPSKVENELGLGPDRDDLVGRLFKDLPEKTRHWAADRCTLHPRACFYEPVKLKNFWNQKWDADVLYCTKAENPGEAHIRRAADALSARWHVLETDHYPMLSKPDELAKIIEKN
jgi:pimeloyl-ACP methyl ester carboxylesterase